MAKSLQLEIVTPDRLLFRGEIESLVVPASEGYLGVLPGHVPMITGLIPGAMSYRQEGRAFMLAVSGGFMEVARNRVVVLADTAERAEEIDVQRAERARERALNRLQNRQPGLDVARAELALQRAVARLKVAKGMSM